MKLLLPALTLSTLVLSLSGITLAQGTPDYSGVWDIRAAGEDGTVVTQAVTITQAVKDGQIYLSGYSFSGPIKNGVGTVYKITKFKEYTRTESGTLSIKARSLSGSGTVRETYNSGDVIVTKYKITGGRRG